MIRHREYCATITIVNCLPTGRVLKSLREDNVARFEIGDSVAIVSKTPGVSLDSSLVFIGDVGEVVSRQLVSVPEFWCEEMERHRSKKYIYRVRFSYPQRHYQVDYSFYYEDLTPSKISVKERSEKMTEYEKVPNRRLSILNFKRSGACFDRLGRLMGMLVAQDSRYTKSSKVIPLTTLLNFTSASDQQWLVDQGYIREVKEEPTCTAGSRWLIDDEEFILARIDINEYKLISIDDGNRWRSNTLDYETVQIPESVVVKYAQGSFGNQHKIERKS